MIADEGLPKASINADKYSDELSFPTQHICNMWTLCNLL